MDASEKPSFDESLMLVSRRNLLRLLAAGAAATAIASESAKAYDCSCATDANNVWYPDDYSLLAGWLALTTLNTQDSSDFGTILQNPASPSSPTYDAVVTCLALNSPAGSSWSNVLARLKAPFKQPTNQFTTPLQVLNFVQQIWAGNVQYSDGVTASVPTTFNSGEYTGGGCPKQFELFNIANYAYASVPVCGLKPPFLKATPPHGNVGKKKTSAKK